MQDIVVFVSLQTKAAAAETLLPLILSFEGAFAYKEYSSAADVAVDFTNETSPTLLCAQALFGQKELASAAISKVAVFGVAVDATTANVTAALNTLRETNDDWFFLLPTVPNDAMIEALSVWTSATVLTEEQLASGAIEAEKLLLAQTATKTAITSDALARKQTSVWYNHDAANSFLHAAVVGRVAPSYPKAVTWKWKELAGIPVTSERGTDLHELLEGRYNLYINNHKADYTSEGVCTDGEFIDVVIARWQIKQALRRKLVKKFVANDIIPFDDGGFTMIADSIFEAMNESVDNGIILKENGAGVYSVTIPKRSEATETEVANRIMPPIPWEATLRGGVHGVHVSGVLTINLAAAATA